MSKRIVINELRAWSRKAKANGRTVKVVNNPDTYTGDLWTVSACAYNPSTGKTVFLVIMKSERAQTQ